MQINLTHWMATNGVMTKLNMLKRWTDITSQQKYNELAKQALNCIIAYLLAKCAEHAGKKVCYENFPKIALGRAFAKVYVYFDTPEHKIDEICKMSGIKKEAFDHAATKIIAEKTDAEFAEFLAETKDEYEVRIYKAATKIATYIEFLEHPNIGDSTKFQDIERKLMEFRDIPGVEEFSDSDSEVFKMLQEISNLRNQTRWSTLCYNVECSVLGHLFDTAIFAYLIAITLPPERTENFEPDFASRMFFMGIWHDVAETWTKDIPSPIKDKIAGFRSATECYEIDQVKKHVYAVLPDYMVPDLKRVMLEEEGNEEYKVLLKEADYLSGDSECYRNLLAGSRDPEFVKVITRKRNFTSQLCYDAHNVIKKYSQKVKL